MNVTEVVMTGKIPVYKIWRGGLILNAVSELAFFEEIVRLLDAGKRCEIEVENSEGEDEIYFVDDSESLRVFRGIFFSGKVGPVSAMITDVWEVEE